MAGALRRERVADLLQLVGGAGVLRLRGVVEVEHAVLVDHDVLQDRPEGVRRLVDLGLGLRGEPDDLRVTAALEVEDPAVSPAVLVVADQRPFGVGGERRLAGAGEPEEDRHTAVVVDVGRAVHREDTLQREPVVHHREDRLLDLARVERAADEHLGAARVQDDEGAATGAVLRGIGLHRRCVENERVGLEGFELLGGRIDEHRLREQRVVRPVGDHPHRDAMGGVGAGERIDHVQVLPLEMVDDFLAQSVEMLLGERLVDRAPPDAAFGSRFLDHELVLRRAAGEVARVDAQRPAFGQAALTALEGMRVEQRRGWLPVDAALGVQPV